MNANGKCMRWTHCGTKTTNDMEDKEKILHIEIGRTVDDMLNGLIHPLTAKQRIFDSCKKASEANDIHNVSECDHDYVEDVACGVNLWVCSKCGDTN